MLKLEKLKQNYDFRRLYNKGSACVSSCFVLYYKKTSNEKIRLGLTAGKKLGCAVKRNRAKRLMYAAFTSCLSGIKPGYDFVIVARTRILSMKSNQVAEKMKKHLTNAGLWCAHENNK